jgi:hypothetical protein
MDCLNPLKYNGPCMNNNSTIALSNVLQEFIDSMQWTFAKTMPEWPHEYIVRSRAFDERFEQLVCHIRERGYEGKFYQKTITYYDDRGMVYWTMGAPLDETIIINRCKKEDTYECRLLKGTLPEFKGIGAEPVNPLDPRSSGR